MLNPSLAARLLLATGLAIGCAAAPALSAGPMPVARRTFGILAADLTLDKVYLVRDLNSDGDASDAGEVTVFFDGTNASGLASPTGAIFSMFQSDDGTVYLGDGDTDTVYAVKDRNNDGDALDAGEARVYFSSFNAALITLPTPNGITQGADGSIYVSNAGVTASPQDGIYRTKDMTTDGDALDAGEQNIFVDETALMVTNANPFECAAIGNTVYFLDIRGSADDVILAGRDLDNNGSVDAAELGTYFLAGVSGPIPAVPTGFTCQTDGTSLYVHESSASATQTVWRLTDLDNSGSIDTAGEGVMIWTEGNLPSGAAMANSFSLSLGPRKLAISSNGSDLLDEIIIATDLNGDGDYNDVGGTTVLIQGVAGSSFPENIRLLMFYGSPCPADINGSGSVTVQDIFDFLAFYFANDPRADINGVGGITVQDIFDFLASYFAGCP